MNELQNIDGFNAKIYGTAEAPLFLAKDIAEMLEITNVSQLMNSVDEDEKLTSTLYISGQNRQMWFLTEYGLYEVLMTSRKPQAKLFKKKVKEILKVIRKHGAYLTNEKAYQITHNKGALADLLLQAGNQLKEAQLKIEEMKPKALFAEAVETSKTSILVGELAKILNANGIKIGQNRLFEWLREKGYLISRKGSDYNMPTQKSMDLKLFEIKEGTRLSADGHINITKTSKVTGKGQTYFINKFLRNSL